MEWMERLIELLTPVGQEAVRQVAFRGFVFTLVGALVLCFGVIAAFRFEKAGIKACKDSEDATVFAAFVWGVATFSGFLVGSITFGEGLSEWLAPLPTILEL